MSAVAENVGKGESFSSAPVADNPEFFPLSAAQQRLWFLEQLHPGTAVYHVPQAWRVTGPLQLDAFQRAVNEVIARHETLRTTFVSLHGKPAQLIAPFQPRTFPVTDLSQTGDRERDAKRLVAETIRRPFDLKAEPLFRLHILRLAPDEHLIVFNLHHLVSDAHSFEILRCEIGIFYEAFAAGRSTTLPELPVQYLDYAAWEREQTQVGALKNEIAWWRDRLAGEVPALELPADHSRPRGASHRGASEGFSIPSHVTEVLRTIGRREGATLFMVLLAAFKTFLHRCTGREDLIVGSPVSTRTREELEGQVGLFINTLALRTSLADDPAFTELLARVRDTVAGAFSHAGMPFDEVIREIQPERGPDASPLVNVVFALQNGFPSAWTLGGLRAELVDVETGTAKFDWTFLLEETGCGVKGRLEYNTDLFEANTIKRLLRHFGILLEGIAADPRRRLSQFPLLTDAEQRQLLVDWNGPNTPYERDVRVHELFAAQAAQKPEAIALVFGDRTMSYGELNRRADTFARRLKDAGGGPGALVALCLERSFEMIVAMLAILKAGAAYVPLDRFSPRERLRFMIADTGAVALITDSQFQKSWEPIEESLRVITVDAGEGGAAVPAAGSRHRPGAGSGTDGETPAEPAGEDAWRHDPAYVMYTSGSTGTPKGLAVPHRGIVRLVRNTNYVRLSANDVFLQLAPISFDASTFEIWACLLNGGKLVIFPPETPSLEELGRVIRREGVTVLWLTAGLFHQMIDEQAASLATVRQLLAGGDVLSVPHVLKALRELPDCQLINGYGPTENTTFTCCFRPSKNWPGGASVPIGKPISNTQVFILDAHLALMPVGVPGELCIAGDGLARGYWNRPDLTAEKFVPNPFAPNSFLYRTGDLARWLPDGNIEFLGRRDQQVKIRGFRVEPGEIEAALAQHPLVSAGAVAAHPEKSGSRQLVAYIVPQPGKDLPEIALREFLAAKLPAHMIPSAFVFLDQLPLTANGKIDRRALPEPASERAAAPAEPPRNPIEEGLAAIWREVLGRNSFGVHDNFFHLGGHSLLATQVISRVARTFGKELPLRTLFEAPTIALLAVALENGGGERSGPPRLGPRPRRSRAEQLLAGLDRLSDAEVENLLSESKLKTVAP